MTMLRFAMLVILALASRMVAAQPSGGVSCSTLSATSVNGTFTPTSPLNLTGTISLACNRSSGPKDRVLWLGIDDGPGTPARNLDRVGGGASLPYAIYRNPGNTGSWTTGPGLDLGSAGTGGTLVALNFNGGDNFSATVGYYLQVLANSYVMAGTYSDNPVTLTARLNSETGMNLASATFMPSVRVPDFCRLSTPPGNMALNYTSFSGTAATASTTFGVQCLRGTSYALSLDAAGGSALGLNYTLGLSSPGGSGSGIEQTYTINGSIAPGQGGVCASASCSATQPRTLTITY